MNRRQFLAAMTAGAMATPVLAKHPAQSIIAMKVFGQEHLVGAASPQKLLSYTWSLPVSLASVGMPRPELIETNVNLARNFKPLSAKERKALVDSIDAGRKHALLRFFRDHADV